MPEPRSIDTLANIYQDWCEAQKLDLVSADELQLDPKLTPGQKEWLENFITEWDKAAEVDGAM